MADGYTLTGTLSQLVQVSIADSATVTLSGASINADSGFNSSEVTGIPALACLGDATIIIADGTENTVFGIHNPYTGGGAGIYVPSGSTVTVTGNGTLTVQGAITESPYTYDPSAFWLILSFFCVRDSSSSPKGLFCNERSEWKNGARLARNCG